VASEMEHAHGIMQYINEHYPFLLVVATVLSGSLMWVKRKIINDVYATKEELAEVEDKLESHIDAHEKREFALHEKNRKENQEAHQNVIDKIDNLTEKFIEHLDK
jgi:hypothetical protein